MRIGYRITFKRMAYDTLKISIINPVLDAIVDEGMTERIEDLRPCSLIALNFEV